jgi:CheY-like chemotaxis protein
MNHPGLWGRSILVVEDELLIAMDIAGALEKAGARATMTTTVRHALILVEHDGLSGAIMDHALSDGDSTALCARLKARGIPYLSYSGYSAVAGAYLATPHITKPVPMDFLMSALEELLPSTPRIS